MPEISADRMADPHREGADHPHGRAARRDRGRLRRAQGDGAPTTPAGTDVPRRLPRLGHNARGRDQVPLQGGHHPGRSRQTCLLAGAGGDHGSDHHDLPRDPDGREPDSRGPRYRHLLSAGDLLRVDHRRTHGRLVERQQVRADRRVAFGGAVDRLRAADGPVGGGGGDARGIALAGRHRPGAGLDVRVVAAGPRPRLVPRVRDGGDRRR